MIKILFLIHDLGQGGAEKVLVNLVNNMDRKKFSITVMSLFGGGVNEQFLKKDIRYLTVFSKAFPGNSHLMKLFSPKTLHTWFIKEKYDIEVSYLEGPSARIISGCQDERTKLVSWIHCTLNKKSEIARSFRNYNEAKASYSRMDEIVFVSNSVREVFLSNLKYAGKTAVLYNTVESEGIRKQALELTNGITDKNEIRLISVGTLKEIKGFDRLLRIVNRLVKEGHLVSLYLLGIGPLEEKFKIYIKENELDNHVFLLGYQTNPFKYMSKCDLYVCSSYAEGFSTAVTEALILGLPVCTVNVAGMIELLGENNDYGIVTNNCEESLYNALKSLIMQPKILDSYRKKAHERGKDFRTQETVLAVENMFLSLIS